jgi:ribosome-associated protein
MDALRPHRGVVIDVATVTFSTTTSSGPGGQHANRTQSKVVGRLDLRTAPGLGPVLRQRAISALGPVLEATSQTARSQAQNKQLVLERLEAKLMAALHVDAPRRATKATKASSVRRVDAKARRGAVKQHRRRPTLDD